MNAYQAPLTGLRRREPEAPMTKKILGEILWAKLLGEDSLDGYSPSQHITKAALELLQKTSSARQA
jgi:hypothetical protein